jgi:hypothetical protein
MSSETSSIVMVDGVKDHVEDDPVVIVGMGMFPSLSLLYATTSIPSLVIQ